MAQISAQFVVNVALKTNTAFQVLRRKPGNSAIKLHSLSIPHLFIMARFERQKQALPELPTED